MLKILSNLNIWQAKIMPEKSIPNITVLIPTYNEEADIGTTLDAAVALDYLAKEILVVDEGLSKIFVFGGEMKPVE